MPQDGDLGGDGMEGVEMTGFDLDLMKTRVKNKFLHHPVPKSAKMQSPSPETSTQ